MAGTEFSRMGRSIRTLGLIAALGLALPVVAEPPARPQSDDEFIESLGQRYAEQPLDRQRVARLLAGAATTLDGDRVTLEFLQSRTAPLDPAWHTEGSVLEQQFQRYAEELDRFRASASALLDDFDSPLQLYRLMMDGARACWRLDQYLDLLASRGADPKDLLAVDSSVKACERFRSTAFQPQVEAIVLEGLANEGYHRSESQRLRDELRELKRQLAELRQAPASE